MGVWVVGGCGVGVSARGCLGVRVGVGVCGGEGHGFVCTGCMRIWGADEEGGAWIWRHMLSPGKEPGRDKWDWDCSKPIAR